MTDITPPDGWEIIENRQDYTRLKRSDGAHIEIESERGEWVVRSQLIGYSTFLGQLTREQTRDNAITEAVTHMDESTV